MVRITGLEPARVAPQAPQACVSTIPPYPHIVSISDLTCYISVVYMLYISDIIKIKPF